MPPPAAHRDPAPAPVAPARWFRTRELQRIYDPLRARWGGPALHVFRTLPDDDEVPPGLEGVLAAIFERALRRIRSGEWDVSPAVAVRIEREETVGGGDEVVVRVFDTGPVVDPPGLADPQDFSPTGVRFRREPPAGAWNGIAVLRVPDRPGDGVRQRRTAAGSVH